MMNPASLMKIMNARNKFVENHPKFAAFLNAVFSAGITEGTVIEITVTKPGRGADHDQYEGAPVGSGFIGRVKESGAVTRCARTHMI